MWIFLIELIGYEKEGPENPEVILAVGMAPPEDSKQASNEAFIGDDFEGEDDEDEFGMDDFEDGYSEDDFSGFDEYDY